MPRGGPRRATLRDVAEKAGVSTTTVSFVLSGRRDMRISAVTEERVLQAARMIGYRRRVAPRTALRQGAPALAVVSDVVGTEAFAGEMLRGCVAAAADRGHVVLMAESEGVADLETTALEALLDRGIERFVYGSLATRSVSVPQVLRGRRVVTMNCFDRRLPAPAVLPDDRAAGRTAVEALTAAGHAHDVWLVGEVPRGAHAARRRLAGITAALASCGVELAGHVDCAWWPVEARDAVAGLLAGSLPDRAPTAIIAMNDRTAMGVYQAASAAGLTIPGDLSVISFDNSDLARWLEPGLTSLALPHYELGHRAVELLLADDPRPGVRRLRMPLRSRQSVAARRVQPAMS